MQNLLEIKRNNTRNLFKSKNKSEKNDQEILSAMEFIEKENNKIMVLHDHKLELLKECSYLVDYHLGKTNEIIKGYEKTVQTNLLNGILPLNEDKIDKSIMLDEPSHIGSSKLFYFFN